MMEAVLGSIPESMGRRAARDAEKYFRRRGKLAWPEAASSRKSIRAVHRLSGLQKHIAASCDASLKPELQPLVGGCCAAFRASCMRRLLHAYVFSCHTYMLAAVSTLRFFTSNWAP